MKYSVYVYGAHTFCLSGIELDTLLSDLTKNRKVPAEDILIKIEEEKANEIQEPLSI